jgi:hypothetical protein
LPHGASALPSGTAHKTGNAGSAPASPDFGTLVWFSRDFGDEEWTLIFDLIKRADFIVFMALNLAHPTSLHSKIINIAGEPRSNCQNHLNEAPVKSCRRMKPYQDKCHKTR